jgi:hypothetical protein
MRLDVAKGNSMSKNSTLSWVDGNDTEMIDKDDTDKIGTPRDMACTPGSFGWRFIRMPHDGISDGGQHACSGMFAAW